MSESPIQSVADTAFMVAVWRAIESERPDALFRDPLARTLAGERGRKILENLPKRVFMGGWTVVIRTCIIDRFIETAIADGVDTILNLGAGLDTRPYRMVLPPSLRWLEVDFPHVIEPKTSLLSTEKPRCDLERVPLDLSNAEARRKLLARIASTSGKTLVLTEGVLPYLAPEAVADLAKDLRAHACFRYWITDFFSPDAYEWRRKQGMKTTMQNAPFIFEPADFFAFFKELGWSSKELRYIPEEADRLKRPMPLTWPMKIVYALVTFFSSRERRLRMKRFAGYCVLEPR